MKLLTATTEQSARSLEAKADAWLRADIARYTAGQWSDVYVSADGRTFGIAWEDRLAPAFSDAETGAETTGSGDAAVTTYTKVVDAQMAQPGFGGQAPVAGWSIVPEVSQ